MNVYIFFLFEIKSTWMARLYISGLAVVNKVWFSMKMRCAIIKRNIIIRFVSVPYTCLGLLPFHLFINPVFKVICSDVCSHHKWNLQNEKLFVVDSGDSICPLHQPIFWLKSYLSIPENILCENMEICWYKYLFIYIAVFSVWSHIPA